MLVAGLAAAFAGMVAMGAGAYISSKSQLEVATSEVERERRELQRHPEREFEELVHLYRAEGLPEEDARIVAEKIAQRPEAMLNVMTEKELRLRIEAGAPMREAFVVAAAFLVGAVVPLTPWFVADTVARASLGGLSLSPALLLSAAATIATLGAMGIGKARISHTSVVRGATEVVAVGLLAAVAGYLLGSVAPHLAGAPSV